MKRHEYYDGDSKREIKFQATEMKQQYNRGLDDSICKQMYADIVKNTNIKSRHYFKEYVNTRIIDKICHLKGGKIRKNKMDDR